MNFIINIDGTDYECKRTVSKIGKESKQFIEVKGFGGKDDEKLYYEDEVRNGVMKFNAEQIAKSLIKSDT